MRLGRQAMADLREFTRLRSSPHVGRDIWLRPDSAVGYVDAGPRGWGGVLSRPPYPPAAGFWTAAEAEQHITWRELRAVRLFVEWYVDALRGRRLLLFEDNQAVVAIVTSLTSRSPELMAELRALLEVLDVNDVALRAWYIRSAENVVADHFSRIARPRDYVLRQELFERVQSWWGAFTVDAFASEATARLGRLWAELPMPAAAGVDAFAQQWEGECAWAHPPPFLLPQLAQFLREALGASACVVTPHWPGAEWFTELMELASDWVTFPAGSLQRVAFDAPARLES